MEPEGKAAAHKASKGRASRRRRGKKRDIKNSGKVNVPHFALLQMPPGVAYTADKSKDLPCMTLTAFS